MLFGGWFALIFNIIICIGGVYLFGRFIQNLPQRRQDIADCRRRIDEAREKNPGSVPRLEEELRGTLIAYYIVWGIMVVVLLWALSIGFALLRGLF